MRSDAYYLVHALNNHRFRQPKFLRIQIIVNIFLPISFTMRVVCSKEPSDCDGSFEYPQHMFWLSNK